MTDRRLSDLIRFQERVAPSDVRSVKSDEYEARARALDRTALAYVGKAVREALLLLIEEALDLIDDIERGAKEMQIPVEEDARKARQGLMAIARTISPGYSRGSYAPTEEEMERLGKPLNPREPIDPKDVTE